MVKFSGVATKSSKQQMNDVEKKKKILKKEYLSHYSIKISLKIHFSLNLCSAELRELRLFLTINCRCQIKTSRIT